MGAPELLIIVAVLGLLAGLVLATVWASNDAHRRTGHGGIAAVVGIVVFFSFPLGPLGYLLVRQFLGPTSPGGTDVPVAAGPPAGWYDNPDGDGKRYWNGQDWTEHTQS